MLWALPVCFLFAKGTKKISLEKKSGKYSELYERKEALKQAADVPCLQAMTILMREGPGQKVLLPCFQSIAF